MRRAVLLFVSLALALAAPGFAQPRDASEEASFGFLPLSRVLPVVGSTPGAAGSFFKTSVQVFNPTPSPLAGRFVYHRSGVVGAGTDPSLDFVVPPSQTIKWDDLLPAMGLAGLGSVDIMLPTASGSPAVIVSRVFNDAGDAGTSGFTEDSIELNDTGNGGRVITSGKSGSLLLPIDLENFRFNIGVRTLSTAVTLQLTVRDEDGHVVGTVSKTMAPSSFLQQEAGAFLGFSPPANGSIRVEVTGAGAIFYGATTDNTTNDPSIQYAGSL